MTDNKTPLNYGLWCTEHEQPMYKKHDTLGWLKCGACLDLEGVKPVIPGHLKQTIDSLYGKIVKTMECSIEQRDMIEKQIKINSFNLNRIKKLKKENEKLKEWKRNMKRFNGTDGIDSDIDSD